MTPTLLVGYLRDHHAGAGAGRALVRRLARGNRPGWATADLIELRRDIERDHESLESIMSELGVSPAPLKRAGALIGERVSLLKLNGRLLQRSPLSFVIELEVLHMGVEGKLSGWRTLREAVVGDPRVDAGRIDELIIRAQHQSERLEGLHTRAARAALAE